MSTAARPRVVAGLRLLTQVGSGAEGEVWEARDSRGRRRALKLIRPDSLVTPDEVQRRGAWLVEVTHPALARVWRTGVLRGGGLDEWGFVEMDFVDGQSLHRARADGGALDRLAPLAEALDLLHAGHWSEGVPLVHRDVKPANLIEQPGGGLVLVDHSTLRAADADTITRIGTPVFAAPEVVTGRMGVPADVYSFCATAVALLTGARGPALADLLASVDELDVPAGLRAGLAEAPRDRPASCRAALAAQPVPAAIDLTEALPVDSPAPAADPTETLPLAVPRAVPSTGTEVVPPAPAARDDTLVYPHAGEPGGGAAPDGTFDPAAATAGPRPVAGWLVALALLAATPLAVLLLDLPLWPEGAVVLAAAAIVHVACHAVARVPAGLAVLAPPVAWGFLLADRAAPAGRRRDWARALVTGGLLGLAAALLAVLRSLLERAGGPLARAAADLPGAGLQPDATLALAGAAVVLVALCVVAARAGGLVLRLLLLPVWAAGAVVLLAGVLLLPFALAAGRGVALLRLLGRTVTGLAAVVRPDANVRPAGA